MIRPSLLILIVFLLQGLALAQTAPVQNTDNWSYRNQTATYGMLLNGGAATPGAKVSGTKVELAFFAEVKDNSTTPSDGLRYNDAKITELTVTCAGASPQLAFTRAFSRTAAGTDPLALKPSVSLEPSVVLDQQSTGVTYVSGAQGVRIASTEFPDGSTISFTIKCSARFFASDGNGGELASPPPHEETHTITATLTAYNRVLLLATDEEYVYYRDNPDNPNQVTFEGYVTDPRISLYKKAAGDAMPLVRPLWSGSVHHTVYPGGGDEAKWSENGGAGSGYPHRLDQKMKEGTALFFFTHGENTSPPHIRASVGPPNATDGKVLFAGRNSSSEVFNYSYPGSNTQQIANRGIPDYQYALIYACSVGTGSALSNALNITTSTSYIPGRCVTGFPKIVRYQLFQSTVTLDQHAKKLMEYLTQGLPLKIALDKLQKTGVGNDNMAPQDNSFVSMPMSTNGDPYARLRFVYLESDLYNVLSSDISKVNTWFYIF